MSDAQKAKKRPVGRLILNGVALTLCSGTIPGVALWTRLIWMSGVFSSRCISTGGVAPCRESLHLVMRTIVQANIVLLIGEALFGMVYDRYGGRRCGYVGGMLFIAGWFLSTIPFHKANTPGDEWACNFVCLSFDLINAGTAGLKWSVYNFMLHWNGGREGKVMFTKNFCFELGWLVPFIVQVLFFLMPNLYFSSLSGTMMAFGMAAMLVVRSAVPGTDEYQEMAEELLAQDFPMLDDIDDEEEDVFPKVMRYIRETCALKSFFRNLLNQLKSGFRHLALAASEGTCNSTWCKCFVPFCKFSARQSYRIHHLLIIFVLGFAPAYLLIYQTACVGYAMPTVDGLEAYNHLLDGLILAVFVSFWNFIMNSFIPPIVARCLDQKPQKGLKKLVWLHFHFLLIAAPLSYFRFWTTQMIFFVLSSYIQALNPYFLSSHIYAYAPHNMLGASISALAVPLLFIYLWTQHVAISNMEVTKALPFSEEATIEDVTVFTPLLIVSTVFFLVYSIIFSCRGNPKVPLLLPEDETNRCLYYGCKSAGEVAYVMDMDEKEDDPQVCLFYSTTEEQNTLVCTMIADNMKENMENLPKLNLKYAINRGFIWQSNVEPEIHRAKLGYGIVFNPELYRYGLPKPKPRAKPEPKRRPKAKAKGKAKEKPPKKDFNTRIVDILSIRMVWAHDEYKSSPIVLVETMEKPSDGSPQRSLLQYPNLKMYNAESVSSACDRLLEECGGWDELSANIEADKASVHKETFESPSYPGMVTIYQRHIVEVVLHEQPAEMIERLAGIGLPSGSPFERKATKSSRNAMIQVEWMTDATIQAKDPNFVLKGQENQANKKGRQTMKRASLNSIKLDETKEPTVSQDDRLPSSVAAPLKAITQNCNTRPFTKHLVRLIRNGDKAALEEWIQGEEREHICHAFKDMHVWTGHDASGLFIEFFSMIPWTQLAEMSTQSKSVKAVVLDLLTTDLKKTQSELDDVIEFERQIWAGELEVNKSDPLDGMQPKDSIVARRKQRVLRRHEELTAEKNEKTKSK